MDERQHDLPESGPMLEVAYRYRLHPVHELPPAEPVQVVQGDPIPFEVVEGELVVTVPHDAVEDR